MNFNKCFLIIFLLTYSFCSAQEYFPAEVSNENPSTSDPTHLQEQFAIYLSHPLNLNEATEEDLQKFPFLNQVQINSLLNHKQRFGKFYSVYELQAADNWDHATIRLILPYISTENPAINPGNEHGIRQQYLFRSSLLNTPLSNYFLYKAEYRNVQYNLRLSDVRQTNLPGNIRSGLLSGGLVLKKKGVFDCIILGEYKINAGQGLVIWKGYATGKTADVINIKKSAETLTPSYSYDSFYSLKGISSVIRLKRLSFVPFLSLKSNYSNNDSTISEKFSESITGAVVSYEHIHGSSGVIFSHIHSADPFLDSRYYRLYGKQTDVFSGSFFYSYHHRNWFFFGENAWARSQGAAMLNGILLSLNKIVSVSFLYRNYSPRYYAPHARSFSEFYQTTNEQGIYSGIQIQFNKKLLINSYFDLFHFPWLRYQADAPSEGQEYFIRIQYSPTKTLNTSIQFKNYRRESNISGAYTDHLSFFQRKDLRLTLEADPIPGLSLLSRIDFSRYKKDSGEKGELFLQQISFRPLRNTTISIRYLLFNISSYYSRIYVTDNFLNNGVLYPFYYGEGSSIGICGKIKVSRSINFWIYFNQTAAQKILNKGNKVENNLQIQLKKSW